MNLVQKYNVAGPRYTSYPTVPYWNETPPTVEQWISKVKESFHVQLSVHRRYLVLRSVVDPHLREVF